VKAITVKFLEHNTLFLFKRLDSMPSKLVLTS